MASFCVLRVVTYSRQTLYHRRKREANCVVGDQAKLAATIEKHCECRVTDFEWYVSFAILHRMSTHLVSQRIQP